jgi:hypothetical protein
VVSHPSADQHRLSAGIAYGFTQPQHVRVHRVRITLRAGAAKDWL